MGQGSEELTRREVILDEPSPFFNPKPRDDSVAGDIERHKRRIEHKRAEMSATIDCIQTKLDPQRIKNQVTSSVRQATVGRAQEMFDNTRYGLFDRVRENPIPAAMAAIGIGWLLTRKPEPTGSYGHGYRSGAAYDETGLGDRARQRASEMSDRVQGTVGDLRGQAQDRVDDFRATAQSRIDDVTSRAQDTMAQVQSRASEMTDQARSQAIRARGGIEQMIEDNPLAVGAIALAVGAAIGLAAPSTQKENEMFGATRDRLMEQAQSKARDAMEKAQSVAQKAAGVVQEEVQNQVASS
ncbi:MAG: DUF3618 domain-containing protein [Chloroflexi bacterium]|nr:DUF3618 domain-containing protein [Chloroflexota bacterium]